MDFCGHCSRSVHNLDSMTEAQREAFLTECSGKVCVSYTVPVTRHNPSKIGIGLAAGVLVAGAAIADGLYSGVPTNGQPAAGEYCDPLREEFVLVGGTNAGKEVQWIDESEAAVDNPELPEIEASEWLPSSSAAKNESE
jgi:hypothetical protein